MQPGDVVQVTGDSMVFQGHCGFLTHVSELGAVVMFAKPFVHEPAGFTILKRDAVTYVGSPTVLPIDFRGRQVFIEATMSEMFRNAGLDDVLSEMRDLGVAPLELRRLAGKVRDVVNAENIQVVSHANANFEDFTTEQRAETLLVHMASGDDQRARALLGAVDVIRKRRAVIADLLGWDTAIVPVAQLAPDSPSL